MIHATPCSTGTGIAFRIPNDTPFSTGAGIKYSSATCCYSNSASATLTKWIKTIVGSNDVTHGMRHSFRDRLRAVEAPTEMIDQLGGRTLKCVEQGAGHDVRLLANYLHKMLQNI